MATTETAPHPHVTSERNCSLQLGDYSACFVRQPLKMAHDASIFPLDCDILFVIKSMSSAKHKIANRDCTGMGIQSVTVYSYHH